MMFMPRLNALVFTFVLLQLVQSINIMNTIHANLNHNQTMLRFFPFNWSLIEKNEVLQYLQSMKPKKISSVSMLLQEPQEDANPDTWSKAYAKPFDQVKNGGGDEPEVNYDYETNGSNGGTSIDPKQEKCTKKVGMFLQGCVYKNIPLLKKNEEAGCRDKVKAIGAECVFGPVEE
jgi:hypothetical protein